MTRPQEIQEKVPLAPLTSYRIGGPARYYARPQNEEAVLNLLRWAHQEGLPTFVLGAGSNVLVADRGYPGFILHLQGFLSRELTPTPEGIWTVGSGASLMHWVRRTVARGCAGAESLMGIPGTIGGALRMNAGAFAVEIGGLLIDTQVIGVNSQGTAALPKITTILPGQIGFSYREAPGLKETVILSARFQLRPGDPVRLSEQLREITALRRSRQPLDFPSCGSVFKRPSGDFAGRLIEAAGLKGGTQGRAQISLKHANFIVNLGGANAAEVIALIKTIKKRVREVSGVGLEREVILLGFSEDEMEGT